MSEEIWYDIKYFEGLYMISDKFRIKRVQQTDKTGRKRWINKFMSVTVRNMYYTVRLTNKKGEYKAIRLHRIIATTFIPNPNNHPVVNHIDGNKQNNSIENLEWCTHGDNARHAYKIGLQKASIGKRYTGQYRSILCLDMSGEELAIFKSADIAGKLLKINRPNISRVLRGDLPYYMGYKFEYAKHAD